MTDINNYILLHLIYYIIFIHLINIFATLKLGDVGKACISFNIISHTLYHCKLLKLLTRNFFNLARMQMPQGRRHKKSLMVKCKGLGSRSFGEWTGIILRANPLSIMARLGLNWSHNLVGKLASVIAWVQKVQRIAQLESLGERDIGSHQPFTLLIFHL